MIDFIKEVLNNNILMVALITVFVVFLFLLAFENVRKMLIGSAISIVLSCGFTLSAKFGSFNSYAEYFLKYILFVFDERGSTILASFHKNILVTLITLKNDCNIDLFDMIGYFDQVFLYIDFNSDTECEYVEANQETKEINPFNTIKNRIYFLKYCFSFRLWF